MSDLPDPPPAHLAGLEMLADPTVVVSADGVVVYANPSAQKLLAPDGGEVAGQPAEKVLALRAEDGGDWWQQLDPAVGATAPRSPSEVELSLMVGEQTRPVAVTGARVEGGPDSGGLVLSVRNADLRRQRDEARSDLVSTVSHELRSPLTSVKGFTQTLLAKWDRFTDAQKQQMLATVNEDADRVTRLLGELLSAARLDAGRLQLKRQMVRLDELAGQVVHRLEAGPARDRTISIALPALPELYADPDRIRQILTNLLENALKYTDGDITVTATEEEECVTVAVCDTGPGIDPAHRADVFSRFARLPGEKRPGTGLGLYITKGLVEVHGGRIWVSGEPGEGATFRFTLPKGGLELAGIDTGALRAYRDRTDDSADEAQTSPRTDVAP